MFEITTARSGSLTEITVTASEDVIDRVCEAMSISSFTRRSGELTQRVRANRREADLIQRRLSALASALREAPPAAPVDNVVPMPVAAPAQRRWVRRVMHLETSPVRPTQLISHGGATLRFTGWGQSFICTDELAEPEFHGQAVRYAYYA